MKQQFQVSIASPPEATVPIPGSHRFSTGSDYTNTRLPSLLHRNGPHQNAVWITSSREWITPATSKHHFFTGMDRTNTRQPLFLHRNRSHPYPVHITSSREWIAPTTGRHHVFTEIDHTPYMLHEATLCTPDYKVFTSSAFTGSPCYPGENEKKLSRVK